MSTDNVKGIAEELLKQNRGPFGIVLTILALAAVMLQLPDDSVARLKDTAPVIGLVSGLLLIGSFGQAYIVEQRLRTKVEERISAQMNALTGHFERLFASHFDDRLYYDKTLEKFTDEHKGIFDRLDRIYAVLEKRADRITHSGDTEKFINHQPK